MDVIVHTAHYKALHHGDTPCHCDAFHPRGMHHNFSSFLFVIWDCMQIRSCLHAFTMQSFHMYTYVYTYVVSIQGCGHVWGTFVSSSGWVEFHPTLWPDYCPATWSTHPPGIHPAQHLLAQIKTFGKLIEFYFLNKGALIIGITDKWALIQRALFWPILLSWGCCRDVTYSTAAPPG